jgi:peptide/nickel transport system ATP-binding protein
MLLVTHDLELAGMFADRIAVMYAGEIVEIGKAFTVISDPQHPYTYDLLHSLPEKELKTVLGQPPSLISPPSGCRYHPRCSHKLGVCSKTHPALLELEENNFVRCLLCEKGSRNTNEAQPSLAVPSALNFTEDGKWHC